MRQSIITQDLYGPLTIRVGRAGPVHAMGLL
jgi:hypothetical protein